MTDTATAGWIWEAAIRVSTSARRRIVSTARLTIPQKPYDPNRPERDLSREEISSLIDNILKLFKVHPGCEEFINDMLKKMNSYSGWNAGSIKDILEAFRQTGQVSEYESLSVSGSAGVGNVDFSTAGNREVRALTALGEIIHTARMPPSSHMNWTGDPNVYSDIEMGRAAYELGVVMSLDQFRHTYPNSRKYEYNLGHAAISMKCLGGKTGVSPDDVKP